MTKDYESDLTFKNVLLFLYINKLFIFVVTFSSLLIVYLYDINQKKISLIEMNFNTIPWNENLSLTKKETDTADKFLYEPKFISSFITKQLNSYKVFENFIKITNYDQALQQRDFKSINATADIDKDIAKDVKIKLLTNQKPTIAKEVLRDYIKFTENQVIQIMLNNNIDYPILRNENKIIELQKIFYQTLEANIIEVSNKIDDIKNINKLLVDQHENKIIENLIIAKKMNYIEPTKMAEQNPLNEVSFSLGVKILEQMLIESKKNKFLRSTKIKNSDNKNMEIEIYNLEQKLQTLKNKELQKNRLDKILQIYRDQNVELNLIKNKLINILEKNDEELYFLYINEKNSRTLNIGMSLLQKIVITTFLSFFICIFIVYIRDLKITENHY